MLKNKHYFDIKKTQILYENEQKNEIFFKLTIIHVKTINS